MEARRQIALQKKVQEEKAREEKRIKEENERRKRDKDDTEKRTLKLKKVASHCCVRLVFKI